MNLTHNKYYSKLIPSLLGFVFISIMVSLGSTENVDLEIFLIINGLGIQHLGLIFGIITLAGEELLWLSVTIILIIFRRRSRPLLIVLLLLSIILSSISVITLKTFYHRLRPFNNLIDNINLPLGTPTGYSFPSGHSTLAFLSTGVISESLGGKYWYINVLAVAVTLSRVILGVHYPSDVLAGALLGITLSQLLMLLSPLIQSFVKKFYH